MTRTITDREKREIREMIEIVRDAAEVVNTIAGRGAMDAAIEAMEYYVTRDAVEIDEEEAELTDD